MLQPSVRMMRQPPAYVPNAIVAAERTTTHRGTWNVVRSPAAIKASVMAAMVFCASLAPCEYERKAAVNTCRPRNARLTGAGRNRRRYTMKIKSTAKIAAAKKPSGGEMARLATCLPSDDHLTPPRPPAAAMPEPHRPPMSAWVELLGSPRYQVMRFHEMAPSRADITTTRPGLMASVLAMVLDTFAWKNATVTTAPTRLKTAESPTAARGERARVEIEVAIALAVSWNPFVKSKRTATPIVSHRRIAASRILDRDRLHDIGRVLASVHRGFEQVVDVLPLDQLRGLAHRREELSDRGARERVALVLEPVDLEPVRLQLREALQLIERRRDLNARFREKLTHLFGGIRDRLYPVSSARSTMSSRLDASSRMSSWSNGVMNVLLTRLWI